MMGMEYFLREICSVNPVRLKLPLVLSELFRLAMPIPEVTTPPHLPPCHQHLPRAASAAGLHQTQETRSIAPALRRSPTLRNLTQDTCQCQFSSSCAIPLRCGFCDHSHCEDEEAGQGVAM